MSTLSLLTGQRQAENIPVEGMQIALVATDGSATGTDTALDNDDITNAYLIKHQVSISADQQQTNDIEHRDSFGTLIATTARGQSGTFNINVDFSVYDDGVIGLLGGESVNTTWNARWRTSSDFVQSSNIPQVWIIAPVNIEDLSGSNTVRNYFFKGKAQLLRNQSGDIRQMRLRVLGLETTKTPLGTNFSGVFSQSSSFPSFYIDAPNALSIATYKDDGTTASATLPYLPAVADTTGAAETSVFAWEGGTNKAVSSINTSNGLVEFTAADAGDIWHFIYETNFVAS